MRESHVRALILALALLLPGVAWAGEPKAVIDGPASVPPRSAIVLDGRAAQSDRPLIWQLVGDPAGLFLTFDKGATKDAILVVLSADPDRVYRFAQVAVGLDGEGADAQVAVDVAIHEVVVPKEPAPQPTPTPQPQPTPGPQPQPTPTPTPQPAPDDGSVAVDVPGTRVIFAYETSAALSRAQLLAFNSPEVEALLDRATTRDEAGRIGYRFWDKDVKTENAAPSWKTLWSAVAPKLDPSRPSVIVLANGRASVSPLPATEADLIQLLQQKGVK